MTKRAKIVTVTSRKGGVGKTVITALLARYFTEVEGKKVLVVDFDARAGISSVLHNQPITRTDLSIAELLIVAHEQGNIKDAFDKALLETGMENSKHWEDNGGKLYLLPSKQSLDSVLPGKNSSLLKIMLHNLGLSDDYIILVDTGPDGNNVLLGIGAADIVFIPLKFSRQDVRPAVETLRTIILEQKRSGNAVLGGMVVNQAGGTKWEEVYREKYIKLFDQFQKDTALLSASAKLFYNLVQSRIIQRGTFMDWSFRENYFLAAKDMAVAIHAVNLN